MSAISRSAIRLPPGVRDFLPRAAARRRSIAERLLAEFEAWGYARIITPLFECADVLERGLGQDARRAAIRFVEPGTGEIVALRPDITPQVARIAATRMEDVSGPLRFCYEGAVTRMGNGARVQREILQAGVELIGASSPEGDAEVISVAAAALATVGVDHVRLDLGHVAPVRYALGAVEDPVQRSELEALLAKKARTEVARAAAGLPAPVRKALEALPTLHGTAADVLHRARALRWPAAVRRALDTVDAVLALSRHVVEEELHSTFTLDLGEVRGFEYYTGIRFAGYADGVGDAVLRGGRYDELVGCYGRPAQATGFAVDIEAIAQAQRASGIEPPAPADGVLVVAGEARKGEGMRLAAALRARGMRAAMHLGERRGHEALRTYAAEFGFTHVLVFDEGAGAASGKAKGVASARVIDMDTSKYIDKQIDRPIENEVIARAVAGDAKPLITALRPRRGAGRRERRS